MSRDIFLDRLKQRATHYADSPAYYTRRNDNWEPVRFGQYYRMVLDFAKSLLSLALPKNSKVAILGINRLEWVVSCMGAQTAGLVSVGVYSSSSKEEVQYVVDHSDAEILVIENLKRYQEQVEPIRSLLPKLKMVVIMEHGDKLDANDNLISFAEFLKLGNKINDVDLNCRMDSVCVDDVAIMIYTSGTTGRPKAVMLSHGSLAWTARSVVQSFRCGPSDKSISYLPLAHIAEQMFTIYAPIECGIRSYFASSFEDLKSNILEVKPTIFFGVPRVYEKMYDVLTSELSAHNFATKMVFNYFSTVSKEAVKLRNEGKALGIVLSKQLDFAKKAIFAKIKEKMGFDEIRILLCGAAPIPGHILSFFNGIDLPIYEIYGQSEDSGPTSLNYPGMAKTFSAGKPLLGSEVKIASDGEILIKGPHVFLGYYKDEKATNDCLQDGWLLSGDVGFIDRQGFLFITDRKKELLITAGGKNVAPQGIEAMLKTLPFVQSAVVVGDSRKYLAALFTPDWHSFKMRAKELGIDAAKASMLFGDPKIHQEIRLELEKINAKLAPVEQIKKYLFLDQEFSIDTGELTPTMKIKRKFVNEKYKTKIESLYA